MRLYENLRSFCLQDYPEYQIVCGVRRDSDLAVAVVRRLQGEFPDLDLQLVIDPRRHGSNRKVSNLIHCLPHCRHDLLVLADSDIGVSPDYLAEVTAPLNDPAVGLVTCLYRGRSKDSRWSRLGALFIDDWFFPAVRLAHALGGRRFGFGATLALRRWQLAAAGGFEVIADQLADDYWLAEHLRGLGLRTVLSSHVVTTDVAETDALSLLAHELRWLRTIRSIQPLGYAFSFVTFSLPLAAIGLCMAPDSATAQIAFAVTLAARFALHLRQRHAGEKSLCTDLWLVIPRDFLSLALWCASFAGWRVRWREQCFEVERAGRFHEVG